MDKDQVMTTSQAIGLLDGLDVDTEWGERGMTPFRAAYPEKQRSLDPAEAHAAADRILVKFIETAHPDVATAYHRVRSRTPDWWYS